MSEIFMSYLPDKLKSRTSSGLCTYTDEGGADLTIFASNNPDTRAYHSSTGRISCLLGFVQYTYRCRPEALSALMVAS